MANFRPISGLIWAFLLVFTYVELNCNGEKLIGGLSADERPVQNEQIQMFNTVKGPIVEDIQSRKETQNLNNFYGDLKPLAYKTQLVNGINYFIKVRAQIGRRYTYYHVKIYQDFSGNASFVRVEGPMRNDDPIEYF